MSSPDGSLERPERRSTQRFSINAAVEFRVIRRKKVIAQGSGEVINMSRDGLLFRCTGLLVPGMKVEISIAWPIKLDGKIDLNLCVRGVIARTEGECIAAIILQPEFRIRGNRQTTDLLQHVS